MPLRTPTLAMFLTCVLSLAVSTPLGCDSDNTLTVGVFGRNCSETAECHASEICVDRMCTPGAGECTADASCPALPDTCPDAAATCLGGACGYDVPGGACLLIGGHVEGLASGGAVDLSDGTETLTVDADGPFVFATRYLPRDTFEVTVSRPPTGQTCTVVNGAGTVGASAITDVTVICRGGVSPSDPPKAGPDTLTVLEDATETQVAVLANDSASDGGDPPTVTAIIAGPSRGTATIAADATTIGYTPTADYAGDDLLVYEITQDDGATARAIVSITVTPVNDPPMAVDDAVTVAEGSTTRIDVLANDTAAPDIGETLSVTAVGSPSDASNAVTLVDGRPQLALAPDFTGTETFSYTVSDGTDGSTASATVTATVTAINDAPSFESPPGPLSATEDVAYTYTLAAAAIADVDDDDDDLTLAVAQVTGAGVPAWLTVNAATRTLSGTPENGDVGATILLFTVADPDGATASAVVVLSVENVNDAPTRTADLPAQSGFVDRGFAYVIPRGTFADEDAGDVLTLSAALTGGGELPTWLTFDTGTGLLSGTPTTAATLAITITATDGAGATATADLGLTLNDGDNTPPRVNAPPTDQQATEDVAFSYALASDTFVDDDTSDTLTLSATRAGGGPLPGWLTFAAGSATFSGTPDNDDVGVTAVQVRAVDGAGATVDATFTLTVVNVNDPPVRGTAPVAQQATEDIGYSYVIPATTFSDPDASDTLTWTVTRAGGGTLPAWLSFDAATRLLAGTPRNDDVGAIGLEVSVTDGTETVSATFSLTVTNANDPPRFVTPLDDQVATEDSAFRYVISASSVADEDTGDTHTLAARQVDGSALPAWLSFTPSSRTFAGTPENDDVGVIAIVVTATDAAGAAASDVFALTVVNTNDAPTVANPIAGKTAQVGIPFGFTVPANTFADEDAGDTLTLTAARTDGSPLPSWLAFSGATFSGTPMAGDAGTLQIQLTATDGDAEVDLTLLIEVTQATTGSVSVDQPIPDQTATEETAFSYAIPSDTFVDANGATLTLEAALADDASLPSWLSFDGTTLTGTPTNDDVGTLFIKITGTAGDDSAADVFALTIANVNDGPTVGQALADRTGPEGIALFFAVPSGTFLDEDAGDTLTITTTLSGGAALPAWLTFDASSLVFEGTPPAATTLMISVTATDSGGLTATSTFTLTVTEQNEAPTVDQGIADQDVDEDATTQFTVPADAFADPDTGDTLTLSATTAVGAALPSWLQFAAETGTFTATPDNDDVGASAVAVTATDESGAQVTAFFTVTVVNTNDPPVAGANLAAPDATENQGYAYVIPGAAFTDPDVGDTLMYAATGLPTWLTFDPASRLLSGTPGPNDVAAAVVITITATDTAAASDSLTVTFAVIDINNPPTVATPLTPQAIDEDTAWTYAIPDGTFADVDPDDTLTLTAELADGGMLPTWLSFDGAELSGTPTNDDVGVLILRVTADDGTTTVSVLLPLTVRNTNDAPTLEGSVDAQTATVGASFLLALPPDLFDDVDVDDTLTLSALSGGAALPMWLTFNADNTYFTGTPAEADEGTLTVTVTATDGQGAISVPALTFDIDVVPPPNDPPIVSNPLPDHSVPAGTAFDYAVPANTFDDPDMDTLTLSATLASGDPLPVWLGFAAGSGMFSGAPEASDAGLITVRVTATDPLGASVSDDFDLTVTPMNTPPMAVADTFDASEDDPPLLLDVLANDVDPDFGQTLTLTDVTIDDESQGTVTIVGGEIRFTPAANVFGDVAIAYEVSDGVETDLGSVAVTLASVPDDPTATDDALIVPADSADNVLAVLDNDTTEPDGTQVFGITSLTAVTPETATATISGDSQTVRFTPDAAEVGPWTFSYTITDSDGLTASAQVTVSTGPDIIARDGVAPRFVSHYPTDGGSLSEHDVTWVRFDEDVDPDTVATGLQVEDNGGPVSGTWALFDAAWVFRPDTPWKHGEDYLVSVTDAVTDGNGNALLAEALYVFTGVAPGMAPTGFQSPMESALAIPSYTAGGTRILVQDTTVTTLWLDHVAGNEVRLKKRVSTDSGSSYGPPEQLFITAAASKLRIYALVDDHADGWVALWTAGGKLWLTRSNGSTELAHVFEPAHGVVDDAFEVFVRSDGTIVLGWGEPTAGAPQVCNLYSRWYKGGVFSELHAFNTEPAESCTEGIAFDPAGDTWWAGWIERTGTSAREIRVASFDGSAWSAPEVAHTTAEQNNVSALSLTASTADRRGLAWVDSNPDPNGGFCDPSQCNPLARGVIFDGTQWVAVGGEGQPVAGANDMADVLAAGIVSDDDGRIGLVWMYHLVVEDQGTFMMAESVRFAVDFDPHLNGNAPLLTAEATEVLCDDPEQLSPACNSGEGFQTASLAGSRTVVFFGYPYLDDLNAVFQDDVGSITVDLLTQSITSVRSVVAEHVNTDPNNPTVSSVILRDVEIASNGVDVLGVAHSAGLSRSLAGNTWEHTYLVDMVYPFDLGLNASTMFEAPQYGHIALDPNDAASVMVVDDTTISSVYALTPAASVTLSRIEGSRFSNFSFQTTFDQSPSVALSVNGHMSVTGALPETLNLGLSGGGDCTGLDAAIFTVFATAIRDPTSGLWSPVFAYFPDYSGFSGYDFSCTNDGTTMPPEFTDVEASFLDDGTIIVTSEYYLMGAGAAMDEDGLLVYTLAPATGAFVTPPEITTGVNMDNNASGGTLSLRHAGNRALVLHDLDGGGGFDYLPELTELSGLNTTGFSYSDYDLANAFNNAGHPMVDTWDDQRLAFALTAAGRLAVFASGMDSAPTNTGRLGVYTPMGGIWDVEAVDPPSGGTFDTVVDFAEFLPNGDLLFAFTWTDGGGASMLDIRRYDTTSSSVAQVTTLALAANADTFNIRIRRVDDRLVILTPKSGPSQLQLATVTLDGATPSPTMVVADAGTDAINRASLQAASGSLEVLVTWTQRAPAADKVRVYARTATLGAQPDDAIVPGPTALPLQTPADVDLSAQNVTDIAIDGAPASGVLMMPRWQGWRATLWPAPLP